MAFKLKSIGRRLVSAALLAGLAVTASQATARSPEDPVVRIDSGVLAGKRLPSGIEAFLGIPYAAPPVRDLRWKTTQPPAAWSGVRPAEQFGPQCFQPLRDAEANQYGGAEVMSEDCLFLNVWARPRLRKAPVVVYIHGGGFYIGSGSAPLYGGEAVAKAGAVFVNLNYRVGPLGFLALPELRAESPAGASGNYGLLDQIAALRWVQRNIARFGGDPDDVTIVGQSAGSMSVLALQASPLAKGLFQRAVGMSGATIGGPIALQSRNEADTAGKALMAQWKADSLARLRALPPDRLIVPRVPNGPAVGPSIDGLVLPDGIAEQFARHRQSDVPLMLGFTRDEALGGLGPVKGLADYRRRVAEVYGERAARFLSLYPAAADDEARREARVADRDATVAASMLAWATLQSRFGKAPVFAYEFARPHNYAPGVRFSDLDPATAGAYHTSEVPFWLGTLDSFNLFRSTRAWSRADRELSDRMVAALVAFARTGNPNLGGREFVRFTEEKPQLTLIADGFAQADWPDSDKLGFFMEK